MAINSALFLAASETPTDSPSSSAQDRDVNALMGQMCGMHVMIGMSGVQSVHVANNRQCSREEVHIIDAQTRVEVDA